MTQMNTSHPSADLQLWDMAGVYIYFFSVVVVIIIIIVNIIIMERCKQTEKRRSAAIAHATALD